MNNLREFRAQEFARREANLKGAVQQKLTRQAPPEGPLHIVYVMTHVGVCGGTKIILEHANELTRRGQQVTLVSHFEKPRWLPIDEAVGYIQVPFEFELASGIPPCDVVVATYWREIYECILRKVAPVVYFEQGDYHLFDWGKVPAREKSYIYKQFQVAPFLFTVSRGAAVQIKAIFGREADVIPNAIDHDVFYVGAPSRPSEPIRIAMMGSEHDAFKRIHDVLRAAELLRAADTAVETEWITPDKPDNPAGRVYVNPPQKTIGDVLRSADYFVSASTYESFSLPVLEAMACGCAVLTTRNKGVLSYAEDGDNCLFIQTRDPCDIARKLLSLQEDTALFARLCAKGRETAARFSWACVIEQLIAYYRNLASYRPI